MKIQNQYALDVTHITLPVLKAINACGEGINFMVRNKLIGFPVKLIPEIKGDYDYYIWWLNRALYNKCYMVYEYDDNGNVIRSSSKTRPGTEHVMEYNEFGKLISVRYLIDYKEESTNKYRYDEHNNIIEIIDHLGCVTQYNYDYENHNFTFLSENGYKVKFYFDDHFNIIGSEQISPIQKQRVQHEVTYYHDGQLKSIGNLTIPFFEK